ncbi:AIPR family protein, partial [Acinetobacter courvalinii]|uniref:AIPR family protein n=1 Tax=Acinetobacter courvalinii TaxID=280147 RepID=UPI003A8C343E
MPNITSIKHPIISSYVQNFVEKNEISDTDAKDEHLVFEQYINDLILNIYTNDSGASFYDMETSNAIGLDGVAIFIADKIVTSLEDVDLIVDDIKKFDVSFYFTQVKTTNSFERNKVGDFLRAIFKMFDPLTNHIVELKEQWEIIKYIYSKSSKFKKLSTLNAFYVALAANKEDLSHQHMVSEIELGLRSIRDLSILDENIPLESFGIKEVMKLNEKITSQREIVISMPKTPASYPKDPSNKIKNAYFGLIKIDQLLKILTDMVGNKRVLRKGIFDDNIRDYLGASEKIEVNVNIKNQLLGEDCNLFGILNNGITIIGDEVVLNSEELTLVNYKIVNGCQTSNVIY